MPPKTRILVAEDDAGVRDLIRTRLSTAGYDTHIAKNGAEALRRIVELRPAGLILDINMPELDGFDVLRMMRGYPSVAHTPVLVLTARHAAEDVKLAIGLGAKDYLSKPFSEAQLMARVERLLRPSLATPGKRVLYI